MPATLTHPAATTFLTGLDDAVREWDAIASVPKGLLIDGAWRGAASGREIAVEDPSRGTPLCTVADGDRQDAHAALLAASAAQAAWADTPARHRARILRRAAQLLTQDTERLALILTLEMGKPVAESRDEVAFAAEYLEWFADLATTTEGNCADVPGRGTVIVRRRPVGTTLVITPWNFPIAVPARGIAAALAAGCTVVHRPSTLTPLSSLALADILVRAGLPAGVLNVVVSSTDDATAPLLTDPRLRKLTFTGSTAVGRHLMGIAGPAMLRTSMELGGLAPLIVFADADLDQAVAGAVAAKTRNGGAACTAANRIYVQDSIAEEFAARFAARIAALTVGRGTDAGHAIGPMISGAQVERLQAILDDAVTRGARTIHAGGAMDGPGHFFAPAVLVDVPDDARAMREEIFGPIAAIATFSDEADVVRRANDATHGLAAYLFTGDLDRAFRVGEALQAGMVAVNQGRVSAVEAPFGGVKQSGVGRSGGADGLDEYLETSYMAVARG